eukprot:5800173-Ditylum_brightwellii.AAC.1
MDSNLIPTFMLREVGTTVNETPKIHKGNSIVDDHVIRMPLGLWGGTFILSHIQAIDRGG